MDENEARLAIESLHFAVTGGDDYHVLVSGKLAGRTTDKEKASDFKAINSFVKKILSNKNLTASQLVKLRKDFRLLSNTKAHWFNKIRAYFTQRAIDDNLKVRFSAQSMRGDARDIESVSTEVRHDYGTTANPRNKDKKKTLTYEKFAPAERGKELQAKAEKLALSEQSYLEEYNSSGEVSSKMLIDAFSEDLRIELMRKGEGNKSLFQIDFLTQKDAYNYTCHIFEEVMNALSEDVEEGRLTPQEAVAAFKERFIQEIAAKNAETIKVDRDTFRDLVGKKVPDGFGDKITIPVTPQLKQFIKDYKDGTWKEGEERGFSYENISKDIKESERAHLNTSLEKLAGSENLQKALLAYFQSVLN